MADLTEGQTIAVSGSETIPYDTVGYTAYQAGSTAYNFYENEFVMIDVSDVHGYVQPRKSAITCSTSDVFIGLAAEEIAITSTHTGNGDRSINVKVGGIAQLPKGAIANTDTGADVYITDSAGTLTTTSTNNLKIGRVASVDDTYAYVKLYVAWINA